MDTIEELRDEYDRLSDQGRDTHSITAAIEAVFNTPNPKLSAVYAHTTNIVRKLRHAEKVQNRSFQAAELTDLFAMRQVFVKQHSWAIPTREVVMMIRGRLKEMGVSTILDVGCGKALWPALINQHGCFSVTAYDPKPSGVPPYMDVVNTIPNTVFDCLMFVWPEYAEPWAYNVLMDRMPDVVLYIGEGEGGCTADDNFHRVLETHYRKVWHSMLPNWPGIHDRITLYRRNPC
jgi:hypothetical protein